jgi:hypothetical protein
MTGGEASDLRVSGNATNMTAIRIEKVFEDPGAVRELVEGTIALRFRAFISYSHADALSAPPAPLRVITSTRRYAFSSPATLTAS